MELETPRMLVLSTSHITNSTATDIAFGTDDVPLFYPKDPRSAPDDRCGYFLPIDPETPWPHTCPTDLLAIRALAEANGCTWIMLDCDGPVTDELPTYEW